MPEGLWIGIAATISSTDQATATPDLGTRPHPDLYQRIADVRERMQLREEASAWHQRQAQVHAMLALAAATGLNDTESGMPPGDWAAWRDAAGVTS